MSNIQRVLNRCCQGDELAVAAEPIDWESEGSGAM